MTVERMKQIKDRCGSSSTLLKFINVVSTIKLMVILISFNADFVIDSTSKILKAHGNKI